MLKPLSGKLKGLVECSFYHHIQQQQRDNPLRRFLPTYHGVALLAPATTPATLNSAATSSDGRPYLVLSDMTASYSRPCVLDVKLGTRTFDESASARKQAEELSKYPLQAALGFRIAGWKRWTGTGGGDGWEVRDKLWGRSVQPHQMAAALKQFVGVASSSNAADAAWRRRVVLELLRQLRQLQRVFEQQTDYRLYASSLLLMYEGDELAVSATDSSPRVCMVDFGHVFGRHRAAWLSERAVDELATPLIAHWHDSLSSDSIRQQQSSDRSRAMEAGDGAGVVDESYLFGLGSLIALLDELLL